MTVISFGDAAPFDVTLNKPNIIASLTAASLATKCESAKVTTPLVFDWKKDVYYEEETVGYFREVGSRAEIDGSLKAFKSPPDLTPHSYIKTCILDDNGVVRFYLNLNANTYSSTPGREWTNFNPNFANWNTELPNRGVGEKPNITTALIAGEVHRITATPNGNTFLLNTNGFRKVIGPTIITTDNEHENPVNLQFNTGVSTNHNLITGNAVRCISVGVNSNLKVNTIYYAIRVSSTQFQLSLSYQDAVAGVFITIDGTSAHEFERQAGWIRIEEGDVYRGNGGDLRLVSGTGNNWVRNPFDKNLRGQASLGSYISTKSYNKGDRVLHSIVESGVNRTYVWECLANQNVDNAVSPALGTVQADLTGQYGEVMNEIPETYIRKDYFDGKKWWNIKGKDVGQDYTILGRDTLINQFSSSDIEQEFHILWFICKKQYDQLSDLEKGKYYLNPAFHQKTDSVENRRYTMEAEEAGQVYTQYWWISPYGSAVDLFYIPANDIRNNTNNLQYLKAGKLVKYIGTIPNLVNNRTYYIKEAAQDNSAAYYKLSETKAGNAISIYGGSFIYYEHRGAIFPVVTKETQRVVSYSNGVFTTEFDHQFVEGQKVILNYDGTNSTFLKNTFYYIDEPNYTNKTFRLASSLENALDAIFITGQFINSNVEVTPEIIDNVSNPVLRVSGISSNELLIDWLPGYTHHGLITGYSIVYKGNLTGLDNGATYYVRHVTSTRIRLALSREDAIANTNLLTISGNVSGSTIELAKTVDVVMPGNNFNVLSVNTESSFNSYRVRYKGLFVSSNESLKFNATIPLSFTIGQPVDFTLSQADAAKVNLGDALFISFKGTEGSFSGGFAKGGVYWVYSKSGNTIQLSPTAYSLQSFAVSAVGSTHNLSDIVLTKNLATSRKNEGIILNSGNLGILKIESNIIYPKLGVVPSSYGYIWPHIKTGTKVFYCPRQYFALTEGGVDGYGSYHTTGFPLVQQTIQNNTIKLSLGMNQLVNSTKIKFTNIEGLSNVNVNDTYEITNKQTDGSFQITLLNSISVVNITGTPTNNTRIMLLTNIELVKGTYFINVKQFTETVTYNSTNNTFTSSATTTSLNNRMPIFIEYDGDSKDPYTKGVYFVRDLNIINRTFKLSKGSIDSDIITGNFSANNIKVTTVDCRFTLHNTYQDSINNQNLILLSSQPDYNNGYLYTRSGTIGAFNTYGIFYKSNYYVTNAPSASQGSIWDAENRGDGFRPGDWLLDQVIYYFIITESRSYFNGSYTKGWDEQRRPFKESNRVALYPYEHVNNIVSYNGFFNGSTLEGNHNPVKDGKGYVQVVLRGEEQSYGLNNTTDTHFSLLGFIIYNHEPNIYGSNDRSSSVTSKAGFSYIGDLNNWRKMSLGGRIRGYSNLGYRAWTDIGRVAWEINSNIHSLDSEWVSNGAYTYLVR